VLAATRTDTRFGNPRAGTAGVAALGRRGLTRRPVFAAGYVVDDIDWFYDPAVSGADPRSRAARERKREKEGKCEGRRGYAEVRAEMVELAAKLLAEGLSYREIRAALAQAGHTTASGKSYAASAIQQIGGGGRFSGR
jgi:hypothetical protein